MDKISVIIASYNAKIILRTCLDSIFKRKEGIDYEVIVVDNASKDDTVKMVKKDFPQVKLIENSQNLGFAKANNLGVKQAQGKYLLFLNQDTRILQSDTLEKLKKSLDKHPDFGLIGPKIVFPDGKLQKSVRNLPTVWRAFQEYILQIKGVFDFYSPPGQDLCEVESINGACMIAEKKNFEKTGQFNEKYFMYFEELELCKEIRKIGLKIGFLPSVTIEHAGGVPGAIKRTSTHFYQSAYLYHGFLNYYLIELILTPRRIINKIKRIING